MELSDFSQKKCNSGKNVQFKPKRFMKLDLHKIVPPLEKQEAKIEVETSSLLIFRIQGLQIDLNSSWKTVVKTESFEEAETAFKKLLPALSNSAK